MTDSLGWNLFDNSSFLLLVSFMGNNESMLYNRPSFETDFQVRMAVRFHWSVSTKSLNIEATKESLSSFPTTEPSILGFLDEVPSSCTERRRRRSVVSRLGTLGCPHSVDLRDE